MAATSNDIANQAIELIGDDQPFVTGQNPAWDGSTLGKILSKIYSPVVATVQRQWGWDASRNQANLALSGAASGQLGFAYEYVYPGNGIEVWEVAPPMPLADPNNPLPQTWVVGNNLVGGTQTKVIWSNTQNAVAIYNNNPSEATWDALFREAVVRLLSEYLAMAIAGRPDFAEHMLETAGAFESVGETRAG